MAATPKKDTAKKTETPAGTTPAVSEVASEATDAGKAKAAEKDLAEKTAGLKDTLKNLGYPVFKHKPDMPFEETVASTCPPCTDARYGRPVQIPTHGEYFLITDGASTVIDRETWLAQLKLNTLWFWNMADRVKELPLFTDFRRPMPEVEYLGDGSLREIRAIDILANLLIPNSYPAPFDSKVMDNNLQWRISQLLDMARDSAKYAWHSADTDLFITNGEQMILQASDTSNKRNIHGLTDVAYLQQMTRLTRYLMDDCGRDEFGHNARRHNHQTITIERSDAILRESLRTFVATILSLVRTNKLDPINFKFVLTGLQSAVENHLDNQKYFVQDTVRPALLGGYLAKKNMVAATYYDLQATITEAYRAPRGKVNDCPW